MSARKKIQKSVGTTDSERYLNNLCESSFLSLWSYSNPYKEQGKELCDLLVVFNNHIIVFSDKSATVPVPTTDLVWDRWKRNILKKGIEQAWGAERWIREHPQKVFLDSKCSVPFPFNIPSGSDLQVHLVVTVHGISKACAQTMGGSGSLMITNDSDFNIPFSLTCTDPQRTFVHVFDDTTLGIILRELDTIPDFLAYLSAKERLLSSDKRIMAAGEEELLGYYLTRVDANGEHDFIIEDEADKIAFTEGIWNGIAKNPQYQAKKEADKISYAWDRLIEVFSKHALAGTQYHVTSGGFKDTEKILGFLAVTSRLQRRFLGTVLIDFIEKSNPEKRGLRVIPPESGGIKVVYVFVTLPVPAHLTHDKYRQARQAYLGECLRVAKLQFPDVYDFVGIATESGRDREERSEDAVYLDARVWTDEDVKLTREVQAQLEIMINPITYRVQMDEYPETKKEKMGMEIPDNPRNKPCPCGNGKKYKKCHGK